LKEVVKIECKEEKKEGGESERERERERERDEDRYKKIKH
jgi:hypothetical protein